MLQFIVESERIYARVEEHHSYSPALHLKGTSAFSKAPILFPESERIYAGVEEPHSYSPVPVAKGALCYYQSKNGQDKWREATTFM
jgi:hypothetical protein